MNAVHLKPIKRAELLQYTNSVLLRPTFNDLSGGDAIGRNSCDLNCFPVGGIRLNSPYAFRDMCIEHAQALAYLADPRVIRIY